MFIDARTIPDNEVLEMDICIIGAGAAGITLALEFMGHPFRVGLLESGDLQYEQKTQSLYAGKNIGLPYFPLEAARLRYFGGTTNHWGGVSRPFDEVEFEPRDWIPYSGWPIRKSDVQPYSERAQSICQVASLEWDVAYWQKQDRFPLLPLKGDRVLTRLAQIAPGPRRNFGQLYREDIKQANNVTTYLNANVTEIETDGTASTVTGVRVACLSGNKFTVRAKLFVLALGGIENARLLLLSNKRQPAGLGNQSDWVGRFFMDQPRFEAGLIIPADPYLAVGFYDEHPVNNTVIRTYLSLSDDALRAEKLMDVQLRLSPVYDQVYMESLESSEVASLKYLAHELRRGKTPADFGKHLANVLADLMSWPEYFVPTAPFPLPKPAVLSEILHSKPSERQHLIPEFFGDIALAAYEEISKSIPLDHIQVVARVEPAPNPDSRITLGPERDELGQNRVQLDWRLSPIDKYSIRRMLEIVGAEFGRAGLGRIQIGVDDDDTTWPADMQGGWHHIGTTRMSEDPKQGVVDKNCQVHGLSNLFIAGSSVFPTAGSGTPTLMLVSLALRLANHITEKMR